MSTARNGFRSGGPVWVVGIAGDADGLAVAAIVAEGGRLHALGPGQWHGWTGAERAALAGPPAPAREMLETLAATMIAALPLAAPPALLVVELPAPGAAPAILAEVTGLPVVHDLRGADLRLGGTGRPLAPVFHHALAAHLGLVRLTILDLGQGCATLSQAAPDRGGPEAEGALCAFETGPGLGLLPANTGGGRKRQGKVRGTLLRTALEAPHLARMPPKVLGPDDFATLPGALAALHPADAAATLRALVAETVAQGIALLPAPPDRLIVAGPGRQDAGTMTRLARALPCPVIGAEDTGLQGDLLAAQALAFAGLRAAQRLPTTFPATTGVAAAVGGAEVTTPGMLKAQAGISNSGGASSNPSN